MAEKVYAIKNSPDWIPYIIMGGTAAAVIYILVSKKGPTSSAWSAAPLDTISIPVAVNGTVIPGWTPVPLDTVSIPVTSVGQVIPGWTPAPLDTVSIPVTVAGTVIPGWSMLLSTVSVPVKLGSTLFYGYVRDSNGVAISGVLITLSPPLVSPPLNPYTVTTGSDGFFSIDVPHGTYTITFVKTGYTTVTLSAQVLTTGSDDWIQIMHVAGDISLTVGATNGWVEVDINGVAQGEQSAYNVPVGATVEMTAFGNTGYVFDHWTDSLYQFSTENPISFYMNNPRGFVANFSLIYVPPPPPTQTLVPSEPSGYAVHAWYINATSGAWYDSLYFYQNLASNPNINGSKTEGAFASGTYVTLNYP